MVRTILVLAALLLMPSQVLADETPSAEAMRNSGTGSPDLAFPSTVSALSEVTSPRMALFKPEGAGPFPALVLFHQCGGLGQSKRANVSMLDWARRGVEKGYVVLLIDALDPRGVDTVCYGPKGGVNFPRGIKDAFQAARHLRSLDYVQRDKVALAGWSWGAMVGLMASRTSWGGALGEGESFRAVVSMYPGCFTIRPRSGPAFDIAGSDITTPILALVGGQDTETPASECVTRLETAKAAGAPVDWHLYPDATHCWDCRQLDGFSKVDVRGNNVLYRHDKAVTEDSALRMFAFLERVMGKAP
jgi:dienelactone hydrolase